MQLPWRQQIVEGMLGADLVGFQRPVAAQNFMQIARRLVDVAPTRRRDPVRGPHGQGRRLPGLDRLRRVRRHRHAARRPQAGRRRAARRARHRRAGSCSESTGSTTPRASTCGCRPSASCSRAASRTPARPCSCRSRRRAASAWRPIASCASASSAPSGRINGEFGRLGHPGDPLPAPQPPARGPVRALRGCRCDARDPAARRHEPGLQGVRGARHRGGGVLVLSEFAGAAGELRQALLVNPHDVVGMRETIARAISLPDDDARRRMRETAPRRCARTTSTASRARFSRRSRSAANERQTGQRAARSSTRSPGSRASRTCSSPATTTARWRRSWTCPGEARPRRESVAALRALAALPDTSVAVISGRSLHDLAALSRLPEEIHLVGSHGTEFDVGFARALAPEALALRDRVTEELHAIAAPRPGRHRRAQAGRRGAALPPGLRGGRRRPR